jgi:hypothetical protein
VAQGSEADRFQRERWTLVAEFDTLAEQASRDGECHFPNDDVSRLVRRIARLWYLDPEDIPEVMRWTEARLEVSATMIEMLDEPLRWIVMTTIPRRLTVVREDVE